MAHILLVNTPENSPADTSRVTLGEEKNGGAPIHTDWSSVMLTALVLICSTAITPDLRDCNRDNAADVMKVPTEFANPMTCFLHGQAFLAETSIAQDLRETDRIKIVCARSQ